MGRALTISVLLGSLLAVPALCMGGVITHACACGSESPCPCDSGCDRESGCDHVPDCGHEGGCPDDPCSIRVVRLERRVDTVVTVSQSPTSALIVVAATTQSPIPAVYASERRGLYGELPPFPLSDLPLLI